MRYLQVLALLFLFSCAGWDRGCSSWIASDFGADWVIVQIGYSGKPFNCWQLHDVAVTNEPQTDGIYWKSTDGHLVHISGWYNRVQVYTYNGLLTKKGWENAAKQVGVDLDRCTGGVYLEAKE